MNSYVVEIPQDEIGAYIERKRRLENERLNLYFVPRTQLVDSINISNVLFWIAIMLYIIHINPITNIPATLARFINSICLLVNTSAIP